MEAASAMQTWKLVDKSTWGDGPWQGEADKAHWIAHGLDCLIVRGPMGALCGYVGLPASHPLHGKDYDDEAARDLSAHGGLTYADKCAGDICHPTTAEGDEVWWLGFDCAHAWDVIPRMPSLTMPGMNWPHETIYRDFAYVQGKVEDLAQQLASMTK